MSNIHWKGNSKHIYSTHRYKKLMDSKQEAFSNSLQEFVHQASYICAFQTSGKISSERAALDLQRLWHQLKERSEELGISLDKPD